MVTRKAKTTEVTKHTVTLVMKVEYDLALIGDATQDALQAGDIMSSANTLKDCANEYGSVVSMELTNIPHTLKIV